MNQDLAEDIRCPVCMEIPKRQVFQCKDGHMICGECFVPELKACPQCRVPYGTDKIRCRVLESLLDSIKFECDYKEKGCLEKVSRDKLQDHLEKCEFGNLLPPRVPSPPPPKPSAPPLSRRNLPHWDIARNAVVSSKITTASARNLGPPVPTTSGPSQSDQIGIEGRCNSSPMDAALMALFLFETCFNECLFPDHKVSEHSSKSVINEMRQVLVEEVVLPLQDFKHLPLASGAITKLKGLMDTLKPDFQNNEIDVDEFISTLFGTVLFSHPFYKTGESGAGFVFQTFADIIGSCPTVQTLLNATVRCSQIFLDEVPSPGFIVRMPVGKSSKPFERVIPTLEINVGKILLDKQTNVTMLLSSVICLEDNKYSVFVRTEKGKYSPWIYLDSTKYPQVHRLPELGHILEKWGNMEKQTVEDKNDNLKYIFLLRAAYICIYVPETQ